MASFRSEPFATHHGEVGICRIQSPRSELGSAGMDTTRVFTIQEGWRRSGINAATGLVAAAAILAVDGQLGPMSFALSRGMAVTALAVIAALWTSRHGRPRVVAAAAIAAAVILARCHRSRRRLSS